MDIFMDSPNTVMCGEVVRSQYWLLTEREVVVMGICVGNLKGGMNIHTSGMGVLTPYPNSSKIHLLRFPRSKAKALVDNPHIFVDDFPIKT